MILEGYEFKNKHFHLYISENEEDFTIVLNDKVIETIDCDHDDNIKAFKDGFAMVESYCFILGQIENEKSSCKLSPDTIHYTTSYKYYNNGTDTGYRYLDTLIGKHIFDIDGKSENLYTCIFCQLNINE